MGRKLIAIGNQMMKDDAIASRIAQQLKDYLYAQEIQIIIGETDVDYCIDQIQDGDDLIILDGVYGEGTPGDICIFPVENMDCHRKIFFTQHQPNVLDGLKLYKKLTTGIFIGIQIADISFGLSLSEIMEAVLPQVCQRVQENIDIYIRGKHDA
jgi:hydrogenase maturation protease